MSTILGRAKFRGRPWARLQRQVGANRCAIFVIATLMLHWQRIEKETRRRVIGALAFSHTGCLAILRIGISPRRARRTGREARASSGSHCSAAPIQKAPVSEQIGLPAHNVRQPVTRSSLVASEGLELPMHPSCQDAVDVAQGGIERRFVETAIVVDPAPDMVVEHPRQIVQRLVAAFVECPVSDSLPDRLECFAADRRTERDA